MIEKPVILIGAPRSGTTLLFSILASSRELWSLYTEGEVIFRRWLHPALIGWSRGNRLNENDLSEELRKTLHEELYRRAMNLQRFFPALESKIYAGSRFRERWRCRFLGPLTGIARPASVRFVEKTPKNSLRVPFLSALFPDATFIFLTREGRSNVSSLIDGWRTGGRFRTYEMPTDLDIDGYPEKRQWTFVLPPGWERYASGRTLADVCAFQYVTCNDTALRDLSSLPADQVVRVRYEDLVNDPEATVTSLCESLGLRYEGALRSMTETLPIVNTSTPPSAEKWRRHAREIDSVLPMIRPTMARLGYPLTEIPETGDRGAVGAIRSRSAFGDPR